MIPQASLKLMYQSVKGFKQKLAASQLCIKYDSQYSTIKNVKSIKVELPCFTLKSDIYSRQNICKLEL